MEQFIVFKGSEIYGTGRLACTISEILRVVEYVDCVTILLKPDGEIYHRTSESFEEVVNKLNGVQVKENLLDQVVVEKEITPVVGMEFDITFDHLDPRYTTYKVVSLDGDWFRCNTLDESLSMVYPITVFHQDIKLGVTKNIKYPSQG